MKATLTWTTILGVTAALIVGCGNTEDSIRERRTHLPAETPTKNPSPILGEWRLLEILVFTEKVAINRITIGEHWVFRGSIALTLAPDGIFNITQKWSPEEMSDVISNNWKDIDEISVTFRGKFRIGTNKVWLNRLSTSVRPKKAVEIDFGLADPEFWYDPLDSGSPLDYSLTDDGNQLELRGEEEEYTFKFIHRRFKNEKPTNSEYEMPDFEYEPSVSRFVEIYLIQTNSNVVCHLGDGVQGEAEAIFIPLALKP